jgi:hypothetical protein
MPNPITGYRAEEGEQGEEIGVLKHHDAVSPDTQERISQIMRQLPLRARQGHHEFGWDSEPRSRRKSPRRLAISDGGPR